MLAAALGVLSAWLALIGWCYSVLMGSASIEVHSLAWSPFIREHVPVLGNLISLSFGSLSSLCSLFKNGGKREPIPSTFRLYMGVYSLYFMFCELVLLWSVQGSLFPNMYVHMFYWFPACFPSLSYYFFIYTILTFDKKKKSSQYAP